MHYSPQPQCFLSDLISSLWLHSFLIYTVWLPSTIPLTLNLTNPKIWKNILGRLILYLVFEHRLLVLINVQFALFLKLVQLSKLSLDMCCNSNIVNLQKVSTTNWTLLTPGFCISYVLHPYQINQSGREDIIFKMIIFKMMKVEDFTCIGLQDLEFTMVWNIRLLVLCTIHKIATHAKIMSISTTCNTTSGYKSIIHRLEI